MDEMSESKMSPHASPTLATLPAEILSAILSLLDRQTAICLSRVARVFPQHCDPVIWRSVELLPPPHHGERPYVMPNKELGSPQIDSLEQVERKEAEGRFRAENLRLLMGMMAGLDRRRLRMIEELAVSPRLVLNHRLMTLLEDVAPTLSSLRIEGIPVNADTLYPDSERLDRYLLKANIPFPSLTHLRLDAGAVLLPHYVLLLCDGAPNLSSLFVDLSDALRGSKAYQQAGLASLASKTRLVNLRIPTLENEPYSQVYDPNTGLGLQDDQTGEVCLTLCSLIDRSPGLKRLALDYYGEAAHNKRLVQACEQSESLEELHWEITLSALSEFTSRDLQKHPPKLPYIRDMLLDAYSLIELFDGIPELPLLERMYFDNTDFWCPPIPTLPTPPEANLMVDRLADILRGSPRLHTIHHLRDSLCYKDLSSFSRLDDPDDITGRISSYACAGSKELLHARLVLQYFPHSTFHGGWMEWRRQVDGGVQQLGRAVGYTGRDGSEKIMIFEEREESAWQHYTDFEGEVVPVEVIERMREVEGKSEEEWQGRGIEVGAEAWQVLLDWRGDEGNGRE